MSRKDYQLLAVIIKNEAEGWQAGAGREALKSFAITLAKRLQAENPAFDYFRFMQACGI